jgi:hypothetical protein
MLAFFQRIEHLRPFLLGHDIEKRRNRAMVGVGVMQGRDKV